MNVIPFDFSSLDAAAGLFTAALGELRRAVPILPATWLDRDRVTAHIARIMGACGGLMALEQGRLVGYLGWWVADDFRGTGRRAAYVPEWAHAATTHAARASDAALAARVYRSLYRAAAAQWAAAGCEIHALTLLAHDRAAEAVWFWNGFGLLVVDSIRPTTPLNVAAPAGLRVRQATPDDAPALAALDAEHVHHYTMPPVFMAPRSAESAGAWTAFLSRPGNSAWLAVDGDVPVGFIRFATADYDGVELLNAERVAGINGAYVHPAYRGRRAAAAILDAGLRQYAASGYPACAVNFESFNPEAAAFWPRYFAPVCLSVMRMPENPTARA